MEHFFLTEKWLVRCVLILNNVRLIDYLNAQKTGIVVEEADLEEAWPSDPAAIYNYQMYHTNLSPSQIILAHESGTMKNTSKAILYEKRISRKFPSHLYEFHLKNGLILTGKAFLKKDILNPSHPFISVTDFRLDYHRPNDPKAQNAVEKILPSFSEFDYIILNTEWIAHFHKLLPSESLLWFPE